MINKWTILLLFLVIVGGGIYLIPKIETTTVQYEKIEKLDCGHYEVALTNGITYHGEVKQIDKAKQIAVIAPFGSFLIKALAWIALVVYVWIQFMVWGVSRHFFVTDFFKAWWEYSHKPVPEEHRQAFRNFFGYP